MKFGEGLMSTCQKCGGRLVNTGIEDLGEVQTALGDQDYRIRSVKYVCESCQNVIWAPENTVDETSS